LYYNKWSITNRSAPVLTTTGITQGNNNLFKLQVEGRVCSGNIISTYGVDTMLDKVFLDKNTPHSKSESNDMEIFNNGKFINKEYGCLSNHSDTLLNSEKMFLIRYININDLR